MKMLPTYMTIKAKQLTTHSIFNTSKTFQGNIVIAYATVPSVTRGAREWRGGASSRAQVLFFSSPSRFTVAFLTSLVMASAVSLALSFTSFTTLSTWDSCFRKTGRMMRR